MSTFFGPDGVTFTPDTVIKEDYIEDVLVTEHPIEDGSVTSDHAQTLPRRIVVTCMVTETPISVDILNAGGVQRMLDAREKLRGFVGKLLAYQSDRFGLFENMMIEGFPHSVETRRSYTFTISLKEVRIAEFASVSIPPEAPAPEAEAGAPDETESGEQPTETPSEGAAEEDKSLLLRGLEGLGIL